MKKVRRSILYLLLICVVIIAAGAQQKPVIAIFPLDNPTGKSWIDNLGSAVTDTVYLSLALMGKYEAMRPGTLFPSESALTDLATQEDYDDVIFGQCLKNETGYKIEIAVYDRRKDAIVYRSSEDFESVFDSFDVADRITEALVEQISGVKVTYGSLLVSPGRKEPYRTEIDGVDMGEGFTGLERIISGNHVLNFYQNRVGKEELVTVQNLVIRDASQTDVIPQLPWLTKREAENFREIDLRIASAGVEPVRNNELENAFSHAFELASIPFLAEWRGSIADRYREWKAVLGSLPDTNTYQTRSYQRSSNSQFGSKLNGELIALPEEPTTSSVPEFLNVINRGMKRNNPAINWLSEASINVDGKKDDWAGVNSVWNDALDDAFIMSDGVTIGRNISWVAAATDGERLYMAMETSDGEYGNSLTYDFNIFRMNLITLRMSQNKNERNYYGNKLEGQNWDTARHFEASGYFHAKAGEIIEMSYPLELVEEWIDSPSGYGRIDFAVQLTDSPWTQLDVYPLEFVLPYMYYAIRSQ
ncbi:MAG: hypothetical protein DRP70_02680 [Spirochaetes bacterium]|nr:MAG: hypothetical protein DRP70_02680 [Spirochaetota bacterium]RKX90489.1 MAG: hypothetical protein DRZ90_16310 [Spirochaetota bacterium]